MIADASLAEAGVELIELLKADLDVTSHSLVAARDFVDAALLATEPRMGVVEALLRSALTNAAHRTHTAGNISSGHVYPWDMEYVRYRFEECPDLNCREARLALLATEPAWPSEARYVSVNRADAEAVVTLLRFIADEKPVGPTSRNLARLVASHILATLGPEYAAILVKRLSAIADSSDDI